MKRTEELHRAIQVGLVPEVRRLVVQGADMDHVLGMRGTSLCVAIEARSLEITKFLLTSGCDVNARDFDGEPPIMLAIRKAAPVLRKKNAMTLNFKPSIDDAACLEIVPIIINHKDCNLNKVDPITKQTAIHYAISEDLTGVVEMLMTSRCDVKCKVNSRDAGGKTALHLAVETGNINMVKHLLASDTCMEKVFTGENVFVGFPFSREGLTVLHTCAKLGHTEIMQILVEKINGERKLIHEVKVERSKNQECVLLNLNAVTKFEKQTCLHLAARNGHEEIVCQLARWRASIDEKDSMNITPLLFSICSDKYWLTGDIAIPKLLLKMGAYPNIRASVRGFRFTSNPDLDLSPLNLAACNNDLELAKLLVKNVADVNQPDNMGNVSLYNALWSNSVSAAFYFLRDCPETNVNIQNVDGSTPLHAVVKITQTTAKSVNVIKDLVNCIFARGGRIASNNTGQTVFMNAFEYENHVLMDVVLEHNKTTFDQIEHGNEESMIEMLKRACELGLVEMLRVLLSHGADIDQRYEFRGRRVSLLYLSCLPAEVTVAKFLVVNGIDIAKDEWIFQDNNDSMATTSSKLNGNEDDDDTDGDGDSDIDTDDGDSEYDDDNDEPAPRLRGLIKDMYSRSRKLELVCLVTVRKYFISNSIPFSSMQELPIPRKLKNRLRYRDDNY